MTDVVLPLVVGAICVFTGWQRYGIAQMFYRFDRPDLTRKLHGTSLPIVGGLLFFVCTLTLAAVNYVSMVDYDQQVQRSCVVAHIVIPHCVLSIADDRYLVSPAARLIYSLPLISKSVGKYIVDDLASRASIGLMVAEAE